MIQFLKYCRIILFLAPLIFHSHSFAYSDSLLNIKSSDSVLSKFSYEFNYNPNYYYFYKKDTSVNFVHQFCSSDIRGNLAIPYKNLLFTHYSTIGLAYGRNNFNFFNYHPDSVRFYNSRTPYSDIKFKLATKKDQYFDLIHTQNISPVSNFTARITRINSDGFFQKQRAVSNNGLLSFNGANKTNRLGILAYGMIRSFRKEENGGLDSDSLFNLNFYTNPKLYNVAISDAKSKRTFATFKINPFVFFGHKKTVNHDSLKHNVVVPRFAISYAYSKSKESFVFSDNNPNAGYFSSVFLDTNGTFDTVLIKEKQHQIALHYFGIKNSLNHPLNANAGIRINRKYLWDSISTDTFVNNRIAFLNAGNNAALNANTLFWQFNAQYIVDGVNKGNYNINATASYLYNYKTGGVVIQTMQARSAPAFFYTTMNANNFVWKNKFSDIFSGLVSAAYINPKFKFDIKYNKWNLYNYTYLDSLSYPVQVNTEIVVRQMVAAKTLELKYFGIYVNYTYQKSDTQLISFPENNLKLSFYYKGSWLKNILKVQTGFDVQYFSEFLQDTYNPALGEFYFKRKIRTGNYPLVDFYFNAKIDKVRIFLKVENLAYGFTKNNYYLFESYPAYYRWLHFGLSWKFFD